MSTENDTIYISTPKIFSFAECRNFLDRGYDDCLFSIEDATIRKPLRINGEKGLFAISQQETHLKVEECTGAIPKNHFSEAKQYIVDWLGLERDLQPFYELLEQHDELAWMPDRYHGLRLIGIPDLFEALCWCVIGQQINLTFAYKLKRRLVEKFGTFITYDSQRHYFFPEPEVLAQLTADELREMQFSRRKGEYIIGIAQQFAEGALEKSSLTSLPDRQQMLDRLTKIRGVGEWTANYVLMKSLQQPNCITYGDTGLQSAVSELLGLNRKPNREEVEELFTPFAGWESYLNIYLWRTLSSYR
ncbi:DNA-3-methyladenine glycosylase family protein [Fodinibius halophilus]|uniref:DNA-3-methyladenine glycosylase II n=1 Tax=Fodinibius halophilus TaxID=1736908 RepID=A0A6M1SZJ9_9BACT|nr:DNA-3-methyladenine glycosylase [Fodinibius halophilus]NGP87087.1 DNA-3-methyladenine glycosylase 2 family protein [Fodinibius halophilus]